jgi:hypothetical protein
MRYLGKPCIHFQTTVPFLSDYNLLPGDDTFAAIRCNGNGNFAEQRTSASGSTVPAFSRHITVFCICQILGGRGREENCEYNGTVYQLFVDFMKVFDSVRREVLSRVGGTRDENNGF